ncbi:MAG: hypothetical protein Q8M92_01480 [Candidatus Subteraquimicrobiales bacterium]|nr:hypothetical protein [Candidatus Subteraquimicrobiales bacterium]
MVVALVPKDAVECEALLKRGYQHMGNNEWELGFKCNIEAFTMLVYIAEKYTGENTSFDYYLSHKYKTTRDWFEKLCISCLGNIITKCTASSELIFYTSIVLNAFLIYYKFLSLGIPNVAVTMITRYFFTRAEGDKIFLLTHYVQDSHKIVERIDELCDMLNDEDTKYWDWFVDKYK